MNRKPHVVSGELIPRGHSGFAIWDAGESFWCTCRISADRIFLCLIPQFDCWHSYIHRNRSQIHKLIKHLGKMSDDSFSASFGYTRRMTETIARIARHLKAICKIVVVFLCDFCFLVDVSLTGPSQAWSTRHPPPPLCELHLLEFWGSIKFVVWEIGTLCRPPGLFLLF